MARGPAYPYVGLQQAVDLTQKMYNFAKRSPANTDGVVREAWEYSPTSSSGQKVLAALRYFGLLEDVEVGDTKQIKISDRAYRILVDRPDSAERKKALKDAALSPKAYAYCWKKYDGETPASMRSHLIFDMHFNEGTVDAFIKDYKDTLRFAEMSRDDNSAEMADTLKDDEGETEDDSSSLESQKGNKANNAGSAGKEHPLKGEKKMWTEVFNLPEGPVTIQMPFELSADSFEDLKEGLDLFKRKIGRMVARAAAENNSIATAEGGTDAS